MRADYHMHLEDDERRPPLPYEVDRIERYVEAARRRGLEEIGITEHAHRFREFRAAMRDLFEGRPAQDPRVRQWLSEEFGEPLGRYVDAVLAARRRGLPVRLGIEVDFVPGQEEAIRQALSGVPWDYVLGSVHFVDGECIDCSPDIAWPGADVDRIYDRYFQYLARAAESGLFDVLAHPDLPKKFGHRPRRFPWEGLGRFVEAAGRRGVAVEINTAGLRKPVGEIYPARELLAAMVAAGLDVHVGSDAHRPGEVGQGFHEARRLAEQAGVRRVVRWEGRARRYERL